MDWKVLKDTAKDIPTETSVLIFNKDGLTNRLIKMAKAHFDTWRQEWVLSISNRYVSKFHPTHWMPMPEPPKL